VEVEVESDRDRGTEEDVREGRKVARRDNIKSKDRNDIKTAHKKESRREE
jgi:hypothetical protein